MSTNSASNNVTAALAALQNQLPMTPLLSLPNQLGIGSLAGISPHDLTAFQQAFQQAAQQVSLQQQLQNYVELMHGNSSAAVSAASKSGNSNVVAGSTATTGGNSSSSSSVQAQAAAAQFFQVSDGENANL